MEKNTLDGRSKPKRLQQIVASNITILRKEKKIDQRDLARLLGITHKDFSFIENGYVDIQLSLLEKIAGALRVQVIALLEPAHLDQSHDAYLTEMVRQLSSLDKETRDLLLKLLDKFNSISV